MVDQWRAAVRPTSPGWIRVPSHLSAKKVDVWAEKTLALLHEQWGEEWRAEDDHESVELLRAAAHGRAEDKALDMLYWPFARPIVVRLNVRVYPTIPLTSWLDEGFEIDAFDTAEMGPAVRCLAQAGAEVGGKQATLVTSHFVFDDGTHQVQVEVEPTLIEMYSQVAFELVSLVAGLKVQNVGTGEPFVPRPVPGYTLADVDTFTGLGDD